MGKRVYTDDQIDFVKKNAKGLFVKDLTKLLNAEFGTNYSTSQIESLKRRFKIRSDIRGIHPDNRVYTDDQIAFVKKYGPLMSAKELTKAFNKKFGTEFEVEKIQSCKTRHKVTNGRNTRFKKGCIPYNKGTKGLSKANSGSFKKGHTPQNWRPVGSKRITKDGYIEIKVAEPSTWELGHVVEWEKVNGPVPPSHCVIFLDGNRQNCDIDNLKLIERADLARFNQLGIGQDDQEITKVGIAIAKIKTKVGRLKREKKNK